MLYKPFDIYTWIWLLGRLYVLRLYSTLKRFTSNVAISHLLKVGAVHPALSFEKHLDILEEDFTVTFLSKLVWLLCSHRSYFMSGKWFYHIKRIFRYSLVYFLDNVVYYVAKIWNLIKQSDLW